MGREDELVGAIAFSIVALGAAAGAFVIAWRAIEASKEAMREVVKLSQAALAGGRIIENPDAPAPPTPEQEREQALASERARREELTRRNDTWFGAEQ